MSTQIVIPVDTRVEIDGHPYRYKHALDFGHVLVDEETGRDRPVISHDDMVDLYRQRRIRLRGIGRPNRYTGFADPPPGEGLTPVESTRAYYLEEFDKDRCPISHTKIKAFIERVRRGAPNAGGWVPSSGAVMAWIRERGEFGFRPDNAMRTRTGKVGRTGKFSGPVERLIFDSVCWYYASSSRQHTETYARLRRGLRLLNHMRRKRDPHAADLEAPCEETLRLRIEKCAEVRTYVARFGRRRAGLMFHGTKPLTAPYVRHTVMIDSTTADHWCGYREETMVPLGRPTVYYAVDVRSRLSIAVTWFGPPSLQGLMSIIRKVLTEWGHVETIVVDNAQEHRGASLKDSLRSVGIDLVFSPVGQPEHKAIVEKLVDGANKGIFRKSLGGSVPFKPHLMERFELDPSETVSATIEDLQDWLDEYFGRVLPYRKHGGIGEKPGFVWARETRQRGFKMVADLDGLLMQFGELEVRTLSREGVITKDGLRFYDPKAVTELLSDMGHLTPARQRRTFSAKATVKVVVDPTDISHCHVFNERTRRWMRLDNVHIKFGANCRTRWEYRQVKAWVDEENEAFSTEEQRLDALRKLRTLISSTSPKELKKARKRHLGLLKDSRLEKRATQPAYPGYAFSDLPDIDEAEERNDAEKADAHPTTPPHAVGMFDPTCGVEPIEIATAEQMSSDDPIPRKAVRGPRASAAKAKKAKAAAETAEVTEPEIGGSPPTAPDEPEVDLPEVGTWGAFGAVSKDDLSADWIDKGKRKERGK